MRVFLTIFDSAPRKVAYAFDPTSLYSVQLLSKQIETEFGIKKAELYLDDFKINLYNLVSDIIKEDDKITVRCLEKSEIESSFTFGKTKIEKRINEKPEPKIERKRKLIEDTVPQKRRLIEDTQKRQRNEPKIKVTAVDCTSVPAERVEPSKDMTSIIKKEKKHTVFTEYTPSSPKIDYKTYAKLTQEIARRVPTGTRIAHLISGEYVQSTVVKQQGQMFELETNNNRKNFNFSDLSSPVLVRWGKSKVTSEE